MRFPARPLVVAALLTVSTVATAQPAPSTSPSPPTSGIKRSLMQRWDVPTTVPHECIFGSAELAPGVNIGRHTHFGVEIGTIVEGEADLYVDGQPVRHVKPGDSWKIEAGKVHDARATGRVPAKALATWVVEKGKPLSTPAP